MRITYKTQKTPGFPFFLGKPGVLAVLATIDWQKKRQPFDCLFGGRGGTWIRKFSYYPLLKFVISHCFIWFLKLFVLFCVIVFPLELSSKGKYKGKLFRKIPPHSRYINTTFQQLTLGAVNLSEIDFKTNWIFSIGTACVSLVVCFYRFVQVHRIPVIDTLSNLPSIPHFEAGCQYVNSIHRARLN